MANREDWGLGLLVAGLALGMVLMFFAVQGEASSFYQNNVAPTQLEAMRPLGYLLDAGILLAFAMSVAGIACFSFGPVPERVPAPTKAAQREAGPREDRGGKDRHRPRPRQPPAPHGST